jgi:hypothetical protein
MSVEEMPGHRQRAINSSPPSRTTRALSTWFFARRRPPVPRSGSRWERRR